MTSYAISRPFLCELTRLTGTGLTLSEVEGSALYCWMIPVPSSSNSYKNTRKIRALLRWREKWTKEEPERERWRSRQMVMSREWVDIIVSMIHIVPIRSQIKSRYLYAGRVQGVFPARLMTLFPGLDQDKSPYWWLNEWMNFYTLCKISFYLLKTNFVWQESRSHGGTIFSRTIS